MSVSEFAGSGNAGVAIAIQAPDVDLRVWRWSLDRHDAEWPFLWDSLSDEERARATRFGNDALRRRYVSGRAALRSTLGQRLGVAPGAVRIVRGARGRPALAADGALDFNVTHTRGVALIALLDRTGCRVGIDIEGEDRTLAHDSLARKFLAPSERAAIAPLDDDARRRAFLRLWTCKEVMSKATGDGLSAPFARIAIDIARTPLVVEGSDDYAPPRWTLHTIDAGAGYFATVAIWRRTATTGPNSGA